MKFFSNPRLLLYKLRFTPLHPQWLAYSCEHKRYKTAGLLSKGDVLDIGCGRQTLRKYLKTSIRYYSLDFPETGLKLYNAKPNVFGDAGFLPFRNETFDTVVLLEVLEHLPHPTAAIEEARRVLKKDGKLIISTPFLYPIHDAPVDYQRWTQHGLEKMISLSRLYIQDLQIMGNPIETGVLLFNLALAWQTLNSPFIICVLLVFLSLVIIPVLNLLAGAISLLWKEKKPSPFAIGYLLIAKKS